MAGTFRRTAEHGLRSGRLLLAVSLAAGCARSVNDYLAEARSGSPSAVKDAVVAIGQILYHKESAGIPYDKADQEAVLYLKEVAATDSVPMDRAEAVSSLGPLRKADASDVIIASLKDPFWLVRYQAVRFMGLSGDEKYAQPLRDLLAGEARAEVRLEVVKALGLIKGPIALRTLLEVFLTPGEGGLDPQVLAYMAIRDLTGMDQGFAEARTKWREFYRSKFGELPGSGPPPAAEGGGTAAPRPAPEKPGPAAGSARPEKPAPPEAKDRPPPAGPGTQPGTQPEGPPPPPDGSPRP
jgi:HEAT repeat protein